MTTKIGIIQNYIASNYPEYLQRRFEQIERCGITYYKLLAFSHHIDGNKFDYTFESDEEYQSWLTDFIYIIIPVELTPQLEAMAELVEDIVFEDIFNVTLSKKEFETRNGKKGNIPTLVVPFITCKVVRWENGDDARLQSIVDMFNTMYNPTRKIDFHCKFDSLQDLEAFKQSYCYI